MFRYKSKSKAAFGRQCEEALNKLLDAAQIASDWKVEIFVDSKNVLKHVLNLNTLTFRLEGVKCFEKCFVSKNLNTGRGKMF